jgi:hypothetical protein
MATVYGRPGEVRQGGGVDGLNAAVCKGDTIRQNDINTFIKALGAKVRAHATLPCVCVCVCACSAVWVWAGWFPHA